MSHIFISYAHIDSQYVFKLQEELETLGFSTWLDEDIEHGSRWWKRITKAIQECGAFLVVMTPEAEDSIWVEKEIMLAIENRKRIFGLLLRGKIFSLLIDVQCLVLEAENDYLPTLRFYKDLEKAGAFRKPRNIHRQTTYLPQLRKPKPQNSTFIDLQDWTSYSNPGQSNFYGLAMLALAFEERNLHERAIFFMRKANKLEPRVRDFHWMVSNYKWTAEHWNLVERIIADPNFWKPTRLSH